MEPTLIVRGAPQEYECRVGAWQTLSGHLERRGLQKALIVHGQKSWTAVAKYFPDDLNIYTEKMFYGGACTDQTIQRITAYAQRHGFDSLIAVGGGKVSDAVKAAAFKANLPVIMLPTLAATCASYTPLSVIYDAHGAMVRIDYFPVSNALVLIEPEVILHSPKELLIAGIGDTLAKWYESDTIISQLKQQPIPVQVAAFAAQKCRDILLTQSEVALEAMAKKELTSAFVDVVETNILLAGMVGGFGDEFGRTAAAHSVHDALTALPASHQQLHGNKVAYGILVQLVIEEKWAEIDRLLPFYQKLGLPTSLQEMNMTLSEAEYQLVAEKAIVPDESIHFMKQPITAQVVSDAMKKLEAYVEK